MALKDVLAEIRKSAVDTTKSVLPQTTAQRRTSGDVYAVHSGVVDGEKLSIAKYMRGVYRNDWRNANPEREAFEKALSAEDSTGGGFLIPDSLAAELIPYQYAQEVVSQMPGVRTYPIQGDSMTWNRQTDVATATWAGESTAATESTTTSMLGQVELKLKKCIGLVKVPNELLDDAGPAADAFIKNDLTRVMALHRDLAFLEGTGGTQPLGLYRHTRVLNTDLSAAMTYDNLLDALYNVELNNGGPVTGWIAHPIVKNKLRQLKDGNGQYLYVETFAPGNGNSMVTMSTLFGIPIKFTTQIGITNRPSTSETWLVGGNWSDYAIGTKGGIKLTASSEADTAFAADQTWIRAVERCDAVPLQSLSFVRVVGINVA